MGGIKKIRGELTEALGCYEKAIALCEQRNVWISISLFYTHAGEIAYWLGKYDLAREYFEKALDVYNRIKYNAGQPIAEAYMALILLRDGNYKSALRYLLKAEKNANVLKISKELGTVLRIKCEFRLAMESNPELNEVFRDHLSQHFEYYAQEGLNLLKTAKENYQISLLAGLSG
jgi:tetratricopeptide (TPR) repeat protein